MKKEESWSKKLLSHNELGAVLPLVFLLLAVLIVNPNFFMPRNLIDVLRTASFSFIVAIPLTFLMSAQGMDLSVGAATSLGGVACAMCLKAGMPIPVGMLVGLLSGMIVGLINGILVVQCGLPAFIATLGMQYVVNGFIAVITNNLAVSNFSETFKYISQYKLFGLITMPIIYALLLGVVGHILLQKTRFGREVQSIGGNTETAYLAGINVNKQRIIAFTMTSVFAALAGMLIASRFATAQPAAGTGTELSIMAGVIIGGTSMFGGQGTIVGSALGCLLLATITNALILMNVSTLWQNLIYGLILIAALFVDKYRRKVLSGE